MRLTAQQVYDKLLNEDHILDECIDSIRTIRVPHLNPAKKQSLRFASPRSGCNAIPLPTDFHFS